MSSQASRVWMIERQLPLVGELDLRGERRLLGVAGRVVVVVVEPGLADGDDARRVEQVDDRVDTVRRVVRVQPDRGVHVVEPRRHLDRRERRRPIAPDRDHRVHAGGARRLHRAVRTVGDPFVVDVAVRVEPLRSSRRHSDRPSWRSRSASCRLDAGAPGAGLAVGGGTSRHAVRRGNRASPLVTATPPGYPPHAAAAGGVGRRPVRSGRSVPTPPGRCRASPAATRIATIRSASSASPITASTAGPGSAFHGSFASRWELVARISCQVASRARLGWTMSHPAAVSA